MFIRAPFSTTLICLFAKDMLRIFLTPGFDVDQENRIFSFFPLVLFFRGLTMDVFRALDHTRFFEGITRSSREALAKFCMPVRCAKNFVIFREGEPGEAMYLLVQGWVRLHKVSREGRETVIKIIKPGEVFAEVILFERKSYPVTAVALTDALMFKILRRDLLSLLWQEDFRNDFIAMLMRKQRYLTEKIQQLTNQDVEQRFRAFLLEQYGEQKEINIEINKKELAAAIGATPETLSRLLQDLNRRQLLIWKKRTIITSPAFWRDI